MYNQNFIINVRLSCMGFFYSLIEIITKKSKRIFLLYYARKKVDHRKYVWFPLYMYACIYIYIYMYVYTHMYVYMHTCMYTHIYAHTYIYITCRGCLVTTEQSNFFCSLLSQGQYSNSSSYMDVGNIVCRIAHWALKELPFLFLGKLTPNKLNLCFVVLLRDGIFSISRSWGSFS